MQVYQLTNAERLAIEALNESSKGVLMIVCDQPGVGCVVLTSDLDDAKFLEFRKILPTTLKPGKVVEFAPLAK